MIKAFFQQPDANAIVAVSQPIVQTPNTNELFSGAQSIFNFGVNSVTSAMSLTQQGFVYLAIILGGTFLVRQLISSVIRDDVLGYVVAFLIVMALSGIWVVLVKP